MKKSIIFVVMLALSLTGCSAEPSMSSDSEMEPVLSNVSAEDCFLCGNGAEEPFYWGQNNVGIINLNTFEVMPIEINHYDSHGALIEENTGCLTSHGLYNDNNGLCAHVCRCRPGPCQWFDYI